MNVRRATLAVVLLGAAALGACGHPEQRVVDQYFGAVRAKDNQTLQSFAAVNFTDPVERWKVKEEIEDTKEPAPLTALVAKFQAAEKSVADNKKQASAYNLDNFTQIDQVKAARKAGGAVPANLAATAAKWDEFNENDRKFKKEVASTKEAMDKEKRHMQRSLGTAEGLEAMAGEVQTKKLLVEVVSNGTPADWVMTLRRYDVKDAAGVKANSRWYVHDIQKR
jgi:hypothetical protein